MLVESYDQTTSQILMIPGRGGGRGGGGGGGAEVERNIFSSTTYLSIYATRNSLSLS